MSSRFIALVRKELLVLARDWHGLMVLFLMPAAFILIMSLAMQDTFGENKGADISYAVLNQSNEELPPFLAKNLRAIPGFHRSELAKNSNLEDVKAAIVRGDFSIAVVIPADFRKQLTLIAEGETSTLPPSAELLLAPSVKSYTQKIFSMALAAILTGQKMDWLVNENADPNEQPTLPQATMDQIGRVNIGEHYVYSGDKTAEIIPNAVQQNVPAWLVFAMFFVVIPLSTVFLIEKQQGTLVRLQVMNISAIQLLLGKLVPYFFVNQIQMVVMVAVGITVVPLLGGQQLNFPHSIGGLFIISAACSIAAIGFALLVATVVKTTMQATATGGVVNVIFGALGGIMVPKFIMPENMQLLTNLSPMSWGLEGFLDVFLRQDHWQAVLPEALYLSIFGLLCLAMATYRFNRSN